MNRTQLERAAEALVTARGFAFHAPAGTSRPAFVHSYPAAMLQPLALRSIEGRRHGRATYDVELMMMRQGVGLPPEERRALLATLEEEMLEVFAEWSEEPCVVAIEGLTIEPEAASRTPHGELAQHARARIITWF